MATLLLYLLAARTFKLGPEGKGRCRLCSQSVCLCDPLRGFWCVPRYACLFLLPDCLPAKSALCTVVYGLFSYGHACLTSSSWISLTSSSWATLYYQSISGAGTLSGLGGFNVVLASFEARVLIAGALRQEIEMPGLEKGVQSHICHGQLILQSPSPLGRDIWSEARPHCRK